MTFPPTQTWRERRGAAFPVPNRSWPRSGRHRCNRGKGKQPVAPISLERTYAKRLTSQDELRLNRLD